MAKLGSFEMAKGGPDRYEATPAHICGSFALHRSQVGDWCVSHRATGLRVPRLYPETLREARVAARVLDQQADWSKVTRTETIGSPAYAIDKQILSDATLAAEEAMILDTHAPADDPALTPSPAYRPQDGEGA